MLIYPSLHYQNGGVAINERCETSIPGLYVAGEASGGVHGRNRLMGNSVLDYNVFGRRAGQYATEYAQTVTLGRLSLEHVAAHEREMEYAGIETDLISPLILPSYTPRGCEEPSARPSRQRPGAAFHAAKQVRARRAKDAAMMTSGATP